MQVNERYVKHIGDQYDFQEAPSYQTKGWMLALNHLLRIVRMKFPGLPIIIHRYFGGLISNSMWIANPGSGLNTHISAGCGTLFPMILGPFSKRDFPLSREIEKSLYEHDGMRIIEKQLNKSIVKF